MGTVHCVLFLEVRCPHLPESWCVLAAQEGQRPGTRCAAAFGVFRGSFSDPNFPDSGEKELFIIQVRESFGSHLSLRFLLLTKVITTE